MYARYYEKLCAVMRDYVIWCCFLTLIGDTQVCKSLETFNERFANFLAVYGKFVFQTVVRIMEI